MDYSGNCLLCNYSSNLCIIKLIEYSDLCNKIFELIITKMGGHLMTIEVTFLGSGDAFSSGGKMHTCIHVKSVQRQFLIDCGASAMIGMKKYNVKSK